MDKLKISTYRNKRTVEQVSFGTTRIALRKELLELEKRVAKLENWKQRRNEA